MYTSSLTQPPSAPFSPFWAIKHPPSAFMDGWGRGPCRPNERFPVRADICMGGGDWAGGRSRARVDAHAQGVGPTPLRLMEADMDPVETTCSSGFNILLPSN